MFENPLWRQFSSQRGYTPPMPGNPPKNPEKDFAPLSQNNGYKRLTKYPLDTAFSEKSRVLTLFLGDFFKWTD